MAGGALDSGTADARPFAGGMLSPKVAVQSSIASGSLTAAAWASADRLLLCLYFRGWRLRCGSRTAIEVEAPPSQAALIPTQAALIPTQAATPHWSPASSADGSSSRLLLGELGPGHVSAKPSRPHSASSLSLDFSLDKIQAALGPASPSTSSSPSRRRKDVPHIPSPGLQTPSPGSRAFRLAGAGAGAGTGEPIHASALGGSGVLPPRESWGSPIQGFSGAPPAYTGTSLEKPQQAKKGKNTALMERNSAFGDLGLPRGERARHMRLWCLRSWQVAVSRRACDRMRSDSTALRGRLVMLEAEHATSLREAASRQRAATQLLERHKELAQNQALCHTDVVEAMRVREHRLQQHKWRRSEEGSLRMRWALASWEAHVISRRGRARCTMLHATIQEVQRSADGHLLLQVMFLHWVLAMHTTRFSTHSDDKDQLHDRMRQMNAVLMSQVDRLDTMHEHWSMERQDLLGQVDKWREKAKSAEALSGYDVRRGNAIEVGNRRILLRPWFQLWTYVVNLSMLSSENPQALVAQFVEEPSPGFVAPCSQGTQVATAIRASASIKKRVSALHLRTKDAAVQWEVETHKEIACQFYPTEQAACQTEDGELPSLGRTDLHCEFHPIISASRTHRDASVQVHEMVHSECQTESYKKRSIKALNLEGLQKTSPQRTSPKKQHKERARETSRDKPSKEALSSLPAAVQQAPKHLQMTGLKLSSDDDPAMKCQGHYRLEEGLVINDRPVYRHVDDSTLVMAFAVDQHGELESAWYIQPQEKMGTNEGYMYLEEDCPTPSLAKKTWVVQSATKIQPQPDLQWTVVEDRRQEHHRQKAPSDSGHGRSASRERSSRETTGKASKDKDRSSSRGASPKEKAPKEKVHTAAVGEVIATAGTKAEAAATSLKEGSSGDSPSGLLLAMNTAAQDIKASTDRPRGSILKVRTMSAVSEGAEDVDQESKPSTARRVSWIDEDPPSSGSSDEKGLDAVKEASSGSGSESVSTDDEDSQDSGAWSESSESEDNDEGSQEDGFDDESFDILTKYLGEVRANLYEVNEHIQRQWEATKYRLDNVALASLSRHAHDVIELLSAAAFGAWAHGTRLRKHRKVLLLLVCDALFRARGRRRKRSFFLAWKEGLWEEEVSTAFLDQHLRLATFAHNRFDMILRAEHCRYAFAWFRANRDMAKRMNHICSRATMSTNLDIRIDTFTAWSRFLKAPDEPTDEDELDLHIKFFKMGWPAPQSFRKELRFAIDEEVAGSDVHVDANVMPSVSIHLSKVMRTVRSQIDFEYEEVSVCAHLRGPSNSIIQLSKLQLTNLDVMGHKADEVYCPLHLVCESCHSLFTTDANVTVCTKCGTARREALLTHSVPEVMVMDPDATLLRESRASIALSTPEPRASVSLSSPAASIAVSPAESRRGSAASATSPSLRGSLSSPSLLVQDATGAPRRRTSNASNRSSVSAVQDPTQQPEGALDTKLDSLLRLRVKQARGEEEEVFRVEKGKYTIRGIEATVMLKGDQQVLVRKGATWIPLSKWMETNLGPAPRTSVVGSEAGSRPVSPISPTREVKPNVASVATGLAGAMRLQASIVAKRSGTPPARASLQGSASSPGFGPSPSSPEIRSPPGTRASVSQRPSLPQRPSLLQVPGPKPKAMAKMKAVAKMASLGAAKAAGAKAAPAKSPPGQR